MELPVVYAFVSLGDQIHAHVAVDTWPSEATTRCDPHRMRRRVLAFGALNPMGFAPGERPGFRELCDRLFGTGVSVVRCPECFPDRNEYAGLAVTMDGIPIREVSELDFRKVR